MKIKTEEVLLKVKRENEVFDAIHELIPKLLEADLPFVPEELLHDDSPISQPLHSMHLQERYTVDGGDHYVLNKHLTKEQVGIIQTQLRSMAMHYLRHYAEFTAMKVQP